LGTMTIQALGRRLHAQRASRGVREVASEIGVSPATLSRVERGFLPDVETFSKICRWLGVDSGEVLGLKPAVRPDVPLAVHFRKDREIGPDTARALADLILAAQRALMKMEPPARES
jgi:transcriptional regulator with XRE-family HTH domain